MFSNFKKVITNPVFIVAGLMLCTGAVEAASFGGNTGTGGVVFKPFYDFMYEAATGYLGRGAAITGGIVGLVAGAMSGQLKLAFIGVPLALFGIFGPGIADSFFTSALIN